MNDPFCELRIELQAAGFFAPSTEDMGRWQRIVACSEGPLADRRYGGRSFWIAAHNGRTYVGTWAPLVYQLPDDSRLVELCTAFLTRAGSMADFDEDLKATYGLVAIDDHVAETALPDERPEQ